jgi:2Fe-2S ferredoxin
MDDQRSNSVSPATVRFSFVDRNGKAKGIEALPGESLMRVATSNLISGIDGDCGGNCACGTCHVRIQSNRQLNLAPPSNTEVELLAFIGSDPSGGFRLGCQIPVTADLEGATISVVKA